MQSRDSGQIFIEFDYKFSDYEIKGYHNYLRYYWRTGSFRFYPCGSTHRRTATPLEWFMALCLLALLKGHREVRGRGTIIFRDMRYDNATFMDLLYNLMDIVEEGGSAVFDDSTQENAVINKLKEIECIMQN